MRRFEGRWFKSLKTTTERRIKTIKLLQNNKTDDIKESGSGGEAEDEHSEGGR